MGREGLEAGKVSGDGVATNGSILEIFEIVSEAGIRKDEWANNCFLAEIIVQKFADHRRIDEILARGGDRDPPADLGQLKRLNPSTRRLYWIHRCNALRGCSDLYIDETTVDRLAQSKCKTLVLKYFRAHGSHDPHISWRILLRP